MSLRTLIFAALAFALLPFAGQAQDGNKIDEDLAEKNLQAFRKLLDKAEEEYRLFFKRPSKPHEYWAAMRFEMDVGKFDLAALHLKLLLERQPPEETDKDLVRIEEAEGMFAFLRLKNVKKWSDHPPFQEEAVQNVNALIKRVSDAVETHLGEGARINKFILQLDAKTREERSFALVQLNRSRERAVPYMVEALRVHLGKPLHARIVEALLQMDREVVPPLLEILKAADVKEAQDMDLRLTILDITRRRRDPRCVPYLWHLSSARQYPLLVQKTAKENLAFFLRVDVTQVPLAKIILTQLAERYYQHQVGFEGRGYPFWSWDGEKLALKPKILTPRGAEELFGLRYAREALDLDPAHRPAQMVFLSLLLERTFDTELDKFFFQPIPPAVQNLLATLDADLLLEVLERALADNKIAVALPAIQVLGQRGEVRAARLNPIGQPRGLVRALFHPDRRIQFAAVQAMLRMPGNTATTGGDTPLNVNAPLPVAAERVLELLQRSVLADPVPKALAGFVPPDQIAAVKDALKAAGFDAVVGRNLPETMNALKQRSDVDVVLLHPALAPKDRSAVMTQIRGGVDQQNLPVILLAPQKIPEVIRFIGHWVFNTGDLTHTYTLSQTGGRWNISGTISISSTLLAFYHGENVRYENGELSFILVFDKKPNFDRFQEADKKISDVYWEPGTVVRMVPKENFLEFEWKNGGEGGNAQLNRISLDEITGLPPPEQFWLKNWVGFWNDASLGSEIRKTWILRVDRRTPLLYGYYHRGEQIVGYFHTEKLRASNERLEFVVRIDKKPTDDPRGEHFQWDAKEAVMTTHGDVFHLAKANDSLGRFIPLNRILAEPRVGEDGPGLAAEAADRIAQRFKKVWVAPESVLLLPEHLKKVLDDVIVATQAKPLTVEERKYFARSAMDFLWKMARGELRGYDVRGTKDAVFAAVNNEDLGLQAVEFLGRLPGVEVQQRLAGVLLDPRHEKLHVQTAIELNRHIQRNGLTLNDHQLRELRRLYGDAKDHPEFRAQLALILGSNQPTVTQSGLRLFQFQPPMPMPMPKQQDDPEKN